MKIGTKAQKLKSSISTPSKYINNDYFHPFMIFSIEKPCKYLERWYLS